MDEATLKAALEGDVPLQDSGGWADVLRRSRRSRNRRRARLLVVATATAASVFVAALAAAGEIGIPVGPTHEPHVLASGAFMTPEGARVGSVDVEIPRVVVAIGRRIAARPFAKRRDGELNARWFVRLRKGIRAVTVALEGKIARILCAACAERPSGRVQLSAAEVDALVNREAVIVLTASDGTTAEASLALDPRHLRRGLMCAGNPPQAIACTRIYTGRP